MKTKPSLCASLILKSLSFGGVGLGAVHSGVQGLSLTLFRDHSLWSSGDPICCRGWNLVGHVQGPLTAFSSPSWHVFCRPSSNFNSCAASCPACSEHLSTRGKYAEVRGPPHSQSCPEMSRTCSGYRGTAVQRPKVFMHHVSFSIAMVVPLNWAPPGPKHLLESRVTAYVFKDCVLLGCLPARWIQAAVHAFWGQSLCLSPHQDLTCLSPYPFFL